ncbi:hypothetical protein Tco_0603654 [Tanacetum coccineum]
MITTPESLLYYTAMIRLSEGYFIRRIAVHFGLISDEGLRGLSVITCELPMIDLHELVRLNICERLDDMWAWVAPGPEWQPKAMAGALEGSRAAVIEGAPADPAPVQAPQPPPAAPRTMSQRIARLEEEVHKLWRGIVGLRGDVDRSITDQGRLSFDVSISRCDDFCDWIVHDENKPSSILMPLQHTFAPELKLENCPEKNIKGVPRSNSISHFL